MTPERIAEIEKRTGSGVRQAQRLNVGFGLVGLRVALADGREAAVKAAAPGQDRRGASLDLEAYMLRELKRHSALPVPEVYYAAPDLLIMEWLVNDDGPVTAAVQRHAAELLADLHGRRFPRFGYERDTLIGPLPQPNPPADRWLPFFRDHRLMHMARAAHEEGRLPAQMLARIERFAGRLDGYLIEPEHPSLIHGDIWTGNVLVNQGRVAGFVDPAIYCAHPEIELAFSTMFGTFGAPFFDAYGALRPIEPGFHETRRDLYNIYPALVHVRLFGASYWAPIERALKKAGF